MDAGTRDAVLAAILLVPVGCQLNSGGLGSQGAESIGGTGGSSSDASTTVSGTVSTSDASDSGTTSSGATTNDAGPGTSSDSSASATTTETEGSGSGPNLVFEAAPSFAFGAVDIGSGAKEELVLTNVGDEVATAVKPQGLMMPFGIDGGTCGETLGPGASCQISVQVRPQDYGPLMQTLTVSYADGAFETSIIVEAAGTGTTDNLLENGGGEAGGDPPAGWTEILAQSWNAANYVNINAQEGDNVIFAGQDGVDLFELRQTVDIGKFAALFGQGTVTVNYSGWARSWYTTEDPYRIRVSFRDGADVQIGTPIENTGWQLGTAWTQHTNSAQVPANAATVRVRLECNKMNGAYCDALFDNQSVTVTYAP